MNEIFGGEVASKTPVICDQIPGLPNFDPVRYMGSWIEQQHVTGEFFQPDSWKCNQATYTTSTRRVTLRFTTLASGSSAPASVSTAMLSAQLQRLLANATLNSSSSHGFPPPTTRSSTLTTRITQLFTAARTSEASLTRHTSGLCPAFPTWTLPPTTWSWRRQKLPCPTSISQGWFPTSRARRMDAGTPPLNPLANTSCSDTSVVL